MTDTATSAPSELPMPHTPEPWHVDSLADHETQLWIRTLDRPLANIPLGTDPDTDRANARRIVAAVNACKGFRTEALQRGVIAELRYTVSVLLTAAADLEAAMDGTTDQFDAECARWNAALCTAQAALGGGTEINVHELLAGRGQIAHIWGIGDVQDLRPDLDDDQAWQVLQDVERRLDSQYGISWDTIAIVADERFGPAPDTAAEED